MNSSLPDLSSELLEQIQDELRRQFLDLGRYSASDDTIASYHAADYLLSLLIYNRGLFSLNGISDKETFERTCRSILIETPIGE